MHIDGGEVATHHPPPPPKSTRFQLQLDASGQDLPVTRDAFIAVEIIGKESVDRWRASRPPAETRDKWRCAAYSGGRGVAR